jgi:hypothetical protein
MISSPDSSPIISYSDSSPISSFSLISLSDPSKDDDILQVLNDSIIISFRILFQARFTHPQTSDSLARRRLSAAVIPAPPSTIHKCHSLHKLSLKGLLIVTSNG